MLQMSGEQARFCLLSGGHSKNILRLPQNTGECYYCHIVQQDDEAELRYSGLLDLSTGKENIK